MRLLVKYPTRVEAGDVVAGWHRPDAPTTPVQPLAAALTVAQVETRADARGRVTGLRFCWTYSPDAWSLWCTPDRGPGARRGGTMTTLRGYAALIAETTGRDDAATLALVEELMREETGGVLDHITAARFTTLGRQAYDDARAWQALGSINGVTLADYCTVLGLSRPSWVG